MIQPAAGQQPIMLSGYVIDVWDRGDALIALDVAQHQLVLGDRRVDLTNLEFELFNYLVQRPGEVVARASIMRDVWGTDYAGGSNVIEVAVRSIRRKLGERSASIETVRGIGYRFIASV